MAWLVCENQGGVSLLAVKQETWGAERMPMFPDEEPILEICDIWDINHNFDKNS